MLTVASARHSDPRGLLRTRPFEAFRYVAAIDLTPAGAYQTAYTVPAGAVAVLEFEVIATALAPSVDVHLVPNAGTVGITNAKLIAGKPTVGGVPVRQGSYVLEAGGTVQARNTAIATNTASLDVFVQLYSAGDTP